MKMQRRMVWATAAAIAAMLMLGGIAACSLADLPLGPKMQVTPPTATPVQRIVPPTPVPTETPAVEPPEVEDVEPAQAARLCGQQGSVTVLFLGESLPEDQPARGASLIRLFQVDYDAGTVRALALPPYLLVDTPALAPAGVESSVLTLTYWEAMSRGTGSERARMAHASTVLAQTLADQFGLVADNYFTVKQGTFVDMIDAWGGLKIDLPEDVDGSPSGFPTFRAGEQVLGGQAVLDYISIYPAAGDKEPIEWARLERQRQVIAACQAQLVRPQTLALVPRFYQDVVTDLSLRQVVALACALQAPGASIEYLSLAPDMVTVGPDNVLTPKMDEIKAFLETSFMQ